MKILSMSGFVPEHICDTIRFIQYAGDRNISHYCGYASDYISCVLQDEDIDGAVFPKSCDSTRIISSYLDRSGKFLYQLHIPPVRTTGALDFFAASIRGYKESVEAYYSIRLGDIKERVVKVNKRNEEIARLYDDIGGISFASYLESLHQMLQRPLGQQIVPAGFGRKPQVGKRIFLVGSFLCNIDIARILESAGLTVVGDTLTESGRLASTPPVNLSHGLYRGIAESILAQRLSPTQNMFKEILAKDIAEIKQKKVRGVIFISQKYCEPYEYLFSIYKSAMNEIGMPILQLSLNDTEDSGKAALVIEAFADMI